jgi:hypothetical protein
MSISKPEEVQFTLECTMSLSEWKMLRAQLSEGAGFSSYPGCDFRDQIQAMVWKAQKEFTPDQPASQPKP